MRCELQPAGAEQKLVGANQKLTGANRSQEVPTKS